MREGGRLAYGQYKESRVIPRGVVTPQEAVQAGQILVGRNITRWAKNRRSRQILGFTDPLPCVGDKLICLKNNKDKGLLNGTLWIVVAREMDTSRIRAPALSRSHAG